MLEIKPTLVVVIHDDITEMSPIIVMLRDKYGTDNVPLFKHSKEGLDFVLENLGRKMVVLLDKNFEGRKEMSGIEVFRKIREQTCLVKIILISADRLDSLDESSLKTLVNNDLFRIESFTSDYTQILNLVDEAVESLDLRIDAIIEDWIVRHPKDKREQVLLRSKDGRSFSMNEILEEIRKETEIGVSFRKNLLKLAIELFGRQKLKLND